MQPGHFTWKGFILKYQIWFRYTAYILFILSFVMYIISMATVNWLQNSSSTYPVNVGLFEGCVPAYEAFPQGCYNIDWSCDLNTYNVFSDGTNNPSFYYYSSSRCDNFNRTRVPGVVALIFMSLCTLSAMGLVDYFFEIMKCRVDDRLSFLFGFVAWVLAVVATGEFTGEFDDTLYGQSFQAFVAAWLINLAGLFFFYCGALVKEKRIPIAINEEASVEKERL